MSGKSTIKNFKAMLANAKLPEDTVDICFRGDLVGEHEAAEAELEKAKKTATDSLAGDGTSEIAERIQALEAQMQDSTYTFRLRALSAPRFRAFKAEHPTRIEEDGTANRGDMVFSFNMETGFEPLLRLCLVDPDLDDEGWADLMGKLTDKQFEQLAGTAWYLNRGDISIPFSSAASEVMRASADE